MAFGSLRTGGGNAPLAEINMVPLIDVMLVLLVIFIITAPLLTHAVRIELPRASSSPGITPAQRVQITIDQGGRVFWNGKALDQAGWRAGMLAAAQQHPQPEMEVRADGNVAYRRVAQVMSDSARAGLTRIGFVTEPDRN